MAFVALAGCHGQITGSPPGGAASGSAGAPGAGSAGSAGSVGGLAGTGGSSMMDAPPPPSAPRGPLRRLSRAQYSNTVRDLLGDTTRPADAFLAEEIPGKFAGSVALTQAAPATIEQYQTAAETLAATAVKNLAKLVPCQPAAGATTGAEEACAQTFITTFGARAFRRPLRADETTGLLGVFRAVRAVGDFALGVQALVAAMLESPPFLYRIELPPAGAAPGSVAPLGPYELASRLSYFLLDTMPDDGLFSAAAAGRLATPADLEREARRLLQDPRARDAAAGFFGQWLLLAKLDDQKKDAKLYPEFNDALRAAMREETLRFTTATLLDGDGRFETLLTSTHAMVNAPLAKLYGVAAPAGTGFAPADLDPARRSGLLTQAGILTLTAADDSTSPVRRGKFVLDQLLCQPPPPPPPNVDTTFPTPVPGQTLRERFATHTTNASCAACHAFIDPLGFGFEHYDAIGRWRDMDGGKAVDATGEIKGTRDINGPFNGAIELGRKLVGSQQARACMAKQWFSFAQGRPDEDGDQVSMRAAIDAFEGSDANLRELVVALVKSDAFRTRLVEAVTP